MTVWLTILSTLVSLALQVLKYLQVRQAIDTSAAAQMAVLLKQVNDIAATIQSARSNPDVGQPPIVSDPFNLDVPKPPSAGDSGNPPASPNSPGT